MRGKKAYSSRNFNNNYNSDLEPSEEGQEDYTGPYYFGPRASRAGFVGMRGKKEDEISQEMIETAVEQAALEEI